MNNLIWRLLQACTNSNTPVQAKKLTSGKEEKVYVQSRPAMCEKMSQRMMSCNLKMSRRCALQHPWAMFS